MTGAVVGGLAGSLGGPMGIAIGANVGSAMGDSFLSFLDAHSQQLADYFAPKVTAGEPKPEGAAGLRPKTTQELLDTAYNSLNYMQKFQAYLKQREATPNASGQYEKFANKETAALETVKITNPALYNALARILPTPSNLISGSNSCFTPYFVLIR